MEEENNIIIYQTQDGKTLFDVKIQDETIWLTQKQMADLFEVKTPAISKHLKNIFNEGELKEEVVVSILETTTKHGAIKNRTQVSHTKFYNLDAIISVGYRVNSSRATQFRKWATNVLKEYIVKGYAINENKLKQQQEQILTLKNSIAIMERSILNQIETLDIAKDVSKILNNFAVGLNLLDDYDHKNLDTKGLNNNNAEIISTKEFLKVVNDMKSNFKSDVFAVPKDNSFDSAVNQIYQTFDNVELYPTLEEKASMLLYLVVKNHSFADGNKRIGASCFLYFLNRNNMLYKNDKPIIDNSTLFALTILIATSNPNEKETVKQIILSVLNRGCTDD